ncbi:MAG: DUF4833 domain-containing protein [Spirochaetes bacterium]|nr:MAG: DUF4833 domain-containing protein [Spirochaetota bacterium]
MKLSKALIVSTIMTVAFSSDAFAAQTQVLFSIENSMITSKAVYVIELSDDFKIEKGEPVYGFWLRPSGSTRAMTWMEKRSAYGIEYQHVQGAATLEMALSKFSQRKITIEITEGKAVAHMIINGKNCIFQRVFIKATETMFGPSVEYAEIIGVDPDSGAGVVERVNQ